VPGKIPGLASASIFANPLSVDAGELGLLVHTNLSYVGRPAREASCPKATGKAKYERANFAKNGRVCACPMNGFNVWAGMPADRN